MLITCVVFLKITTFLGIILIFHPGHTSLFFKTLTIKFIWSRDRETNGWGSRVKKSTYPNSVNMVNLFTNLQMDLIFSLRNYYKKKKIYWIFCFGRQMTNTKLWLNKCFLNSFILRANALPICYFTFTFTFIYWLTDSRSNWISSPVQQNLAFVTFKI